MDLMPSLDAAASPPRAEASGRAGVTSRGRRYDAGALGVRGDGLSRSLGRRGYRDFILSPDALRLLDQSLCLVEERLRALRRGGLGLGLGLGARILFGGERDRGVVVLLGVAGEAEEDVAVGSTDHLDGAVQRPVVVIPGRVARAILARGARGVHATNSPSSPMVKTRGSSSSPSPEVDADGARGEATRAVASDRGAVSGSRGGGSPSPSARSQIDGSSGKTPWRNKLTMRGTPSSRGSRVSRARVPSPGREGPRSSSVAKDERAVFSARLSGDGRPRVCHGDRQRGGVRFGPRIDRPG